MDHERDSGQWDRVEEIYEMALLLPVAERSAYLDESCADDPRLRDQIERLLLAYENNPDFLETPLVIEPTVDQFIPLNQRVGAYRLRQRLGNGGMGVVYLAERDDGSYRMRVAVKIVWPDSSIPNLHERFANERQILADLDHPNISRLYDGGVTPDGLPFLVMEYVDGERITHYSDQRNLGIIERLHLFRAVCEAVRYAHSRQVIHRDLKPSNIFVTHDGVVKLLDFGIARVLEVEQDGATSRRMHTGTGLLSFEYASPEQVRGEQVSAASDLYSLGVVLYELIAGRLPYDLPNRAPLQLVKAISEDPPIPLGEIAPPVLSRNLNHLFSQLLAKKPELRYPSVTSLLEDIDAILEGRPLEASPIRSTWPRWKRVATVLLLPLLLVTSALVIHQRRSHLPINDLEGYLAQISVLKQSIEEGRHLVAVEQLKEVDRNLAGFEWGYLKNLESPPDQFDIQGVGEVESAIFVDNNRSILIVSQNYSELRRWDLSTGRSVPGSLRYQKALWERTLIGDDGWVVLADFDDDQVKFEDYLAGRIMTCSNPTKHIVGFTPWQRNLYSVDREGTVHRWTLGTCQSEERFKVALGSGTKYSFWNNLPLVIAQTGTYLEVWNLETSQRVFRTSAPNIEKTGGELTKISFDPRGQLLAFLHPNGRLELHELQTGRWASQLLPAKTEVLKLLPDLEHQQVVILYGSGRIGQLSLDSGEKREPLEVGTMVGSGGQELTDGKLIDEGRYLLAATGGGRLIVFDLLSRITVTSRRRSEASGRFFMRIDARNRRLMTFGSGSKIQIWGIDDLLRERSSLLKSPQRIDTVAFAPSGEWFAAGGLNQEISLWKTPLLHRPPRIIHSPDEILSLAFSPDGTQLVSAGSGPQVHLWNTETGRLVKVLRQSSPVHVTAFSPDGRSVTTGGFDGRVRITEVATGRVLFDLPHPWEVTSLAFTEGGSRLITGGYGSTIIQWDLSTSREIQRIAIPLKTVWSMAVSPDNRSLAIIGDGSVPAIIRLDTGQTVTIPSAPLEGRDILFTPDGKRIIFSSNDNALHFIEPVTGRQILQLGDLGGVVNSLAISPDGNLLVTGDITGMVRLFRAAR
jgi:serine/threonine protein kinase